MSQSLVRRIEALLFTHQLPIDVKAMAVALSSDVASVEAAMGELKSLYQESAMSLQEVAGGWRLQLKSVYFADVANFSAVQPVRYSRAFWETLAYIAYHQPVTRAEIDAVRGVTTSSNIYRQLFELQWVSVCGHREVPGRPELLATTQTFLQDFSLQSLTDLPAVEDEVNEADAAS